jgi:hypothetical protein
MKLNKIWSPKPCPKNIDFTRAPFLQCIFPHLVEMDLRVLWVPTIHNQTFWTHLCSMFELGRVLVLFSTLFHSLVPTLVVSPRLGSWQMLVISLFISITKGVGGSFVKLFYESQIGDQIIKIWDLKKTCPLLISLFKQ